VFVYLAGELLSIKPLAILSIKLYLYSRYSEVVLKLVFLAGFLVSNEVTRIIFSRVLFYFFMKNLRNNFAILKLKNYFIFSFVF